MIKNLLIDFGGVIADINFDNAVAKFKEMGVYDADKILDRYCQSGFLLEFEEGKINTEGLIKKLEELYGQKFTFEEVKTAWLGFFTDVPQYKLDYLMNLYQSGKYKMYILSNTNPLVMHWARSKDFTAAGLPLDDYFDDIFTSYELGYVKPDKKIFEVITRKTGFKPNETLFVDDGPANIEVGKELGFQTFQVLEGDDWRAEFDTILNKD